MGPPFALRVVTAAFLACQLSACSRYETYTESCPEPARESTSRGAWQISSVARRMDGRVVVSQTAAPLGEATLAITELRRSARSDSTGYFRFDSVPSGRYEVIARRLGFLIARDTVDLPSGAGATGIIRLDYSTVTLDGCGYVQLARRKPWWKL